MALAMFLKGCEVILKNPPKIEICTLGSQGTIINIINILNVFEFFLHFKNALQMAFTKTPKALKVILKHVYKN